MQAIENIVKLTRAETLEEMDEAMLEAHEAVNNLHLQKMLELEQQVSDRLGVRSMSAFGNVGQSPSGGGGAFNSGAPQQEESRRPINPQA